MLFVIVYDKVTDSWLKKVAIEYKSYKEIPLKAIIEQFNLSDLISPGELLVQVWMPSRHMWSGPHWKIASSTDVQQHGKMLPSDFHFVQCNLHLVSGLSYSASKQQMFVNTLPRLLYNLRKFESCWVSWNLTTNLEKSVQPKSKV